MVKVTKLHPQAHNCILQYFLMLILHIGSLLYYTYLVIDNAAVCNSNKNTDDYVL